MTYREKIMDNLSKLDDDDFTGIVCSVVDKCSKCIFYEDCYMIPNNEAEEIIKPKLNKEYVEPCSHENK